jgi:3-oxoacyl-[acyl-carrier protein] reductase
MFDLAGRVVVVTGGGAGIGAVYARALAAMGARVVVADVQADAARAIAEGIAAMGANALPVAVDIADEAAVAALAQQAIGAYGRIDGLVNNAALMSALPRRPWHEIPPAEWDEVMAVNLRGLFLCCRAVYPQMRRQGGGRIVNISSNRVWDGTPNRLHYTASKAGVVGFTRALAREVGDDGITVNCITPGYTESDTQVAGSTPEYRNAMAALAARKCIKRTQRPDDLVGTVAFLLSDASAYITGQTINVDGGFVMH